MPFGGDIRVDVIFAPNPYTNTNAKSSDGVFGGNEDCCEVIGKLVEGCCGRKAEATEPKTEELDIYMQAIDLSEKTDIDFDVVVEVMKELNGDIEKVKARLEELN